MRAALSAALLIGAAGLPGCVIVQTGVTNPIPGMTTVAVAPFINLSAERSVDGRRFALAYHAELQKVPGYQVIPVGVTEQAMVELGLDLDGPDDALKLAKALGADAVVIGAVTDYTPYYPPRIGLQVSWYAPEPWRFAPGVPTDPRLNDAVRAWRFVSRDSNGTDAEPSPILRAQSPDAESVGGGIIRADGRGNRNPVQLVGVEAAEEPPDSGPMLPLQPPVTAVSAQSPIETFAAGPEVAPGAVSFCPPLDEFVPVSGPQAAFDPRRPIMSYTRLFDGSDAELTALLRDYVILSGDLRSGGWEAYLHRTEDFIRFTVHRMIVEMLTLHGGESKRRYVWLLHHDHH